jgi:hypothetical protein
LGNGINCVSSQRIPNYSPARPPAIPLAVRSPYTSIWSSTAGNSTLNSGSTIFWDGTAGGWSGIITVDGISYEWLGVGFQTLPVLDNLKEAQPLSVAYDSQYSNFTFQGGNVELTASFFSPVTPKDLCRTSIPLSYLQTSFRSTDGAAHNVQLYSDVNAYGPSNFRSIEKYLITRQELDDTGDEQNGELDPRARPYTDQWLWQCNSKGKHSLLLDLQPFQSVHLWRRK